MTTILNDMKIAHISAECFPILKAGGLGDVVGSLPKYLQNEDVESAVFIPFFNSKFTQEKELKKVYEKKMLFGELHHKVTIWNEEHQSLGFDLFLIEVPFLFPREMVYGYDDDSERFMFFQIIISHYLNSLNNLPDVIHCHDHHTGLVPFFTKYCDIFSNLKNIPTVYTIHNGEYTGEFGMEKAKLLPEFDALKIGYILYNNNINPMVSGIKNAYAITTVSNGYLEELMHTNNATGICISNEIVKSKGIVNGIDTEVWHPSVDPYIFKTYTITSFTSGKKANKKELCKKYGFNPKLPLIVFVGRLVHEKGAEIIPQAISSILNKRKDVNFLIIGSGNSKIAEEIDGLKHYFPKNYNTFIGYDEPLAHNAYAAADFLIMPSRVEPCGLNQLYAMTYGTIPIVRSIGGLKDTVKPIEDGGEGFTFYDLTTNEFARAIERALDYDWKQKKKHITKLMKINNTWEKSAKEYIDLYKKLTKQK